MSKLQLFFTLPKINLTGFEPSQFFSIESLFYGLKELSES